MKSVLAFKLSTMANTNLASFIIKGSKERRKKIKLLTDEEKSTIALKHTLQFIIDFRKFLDAVLSSCEDITLGKFDKIAQYVGMSHFKT